MTAPGPADGGVPVEHCQWAEVHPGHLYFADRDGFRDYRCPGMTSPGPADGGAATERLMDLLMDLFLDVSADGQVTAHLRVEARALLDQARAEGAADQLQWQLEHGVVSVNVDVLKWWLQVLEKGDPAPVRADLRAYIGRAP